MKSQFWKDFWYSFWLILFKLIKVVLITVGVGGAIVGIIYGIFYVSVQHEFLGGLLFVVALILTVAGLGALTYAKSKQRERLERKEDWHKM